MERKSMGAAPLRHCCWPCVRADGPKQPAAADVSAGWGGSSSPGRTLSPRHGMEGGLSAPAVTSVRQGWAIACRSRHRLR